VAEDGNVTSNTRIRCDGLILRVGLERAIDLAGGADHSVHACDIRAGEGAPQGLGRKAAVFLKGDRLEATENRITATVPLRGTVQALGGLHIGSASQGVTIARNHIAGGLGNGITLGAVRFVRGIEPEIREVAFREAFADRRTENRYLSHERVGVGYADFPLRITERGCIDVGRPDGDPDNPDAERPPVPVSDGPVIDLRIIDNDITDMGLNGIATYLLSIFMPLVVDTPSDAIAVENVEIRDNRILRCMGNEVPQANAFLRQFIGWGGISLSLASDITIAGNRIEDCGATGGAPICGIFIAIAEELVIEGNRILGNGRGFVDGVAAQPGRRGGIVIGLSQGGTPSTGTETGDRRRSNRPALDCHDNEVDAPGARALKAILLGPAHVTDNRLTGAGESLLFTNPLAALAAAGIGAQVLDGAFFRPAGALDFVDYLGLELISEAAGGDAVNLVNLGVAEDLASLAGLAGANPARLLTNVQPQRARLQGGEILFNDNQVSYRAHRGQGSASLSAVFLMTADDISLNSNQIETENDLAFVVTGALALGASIRAEGGRYQLKLLGALLSAVTVSTAMNTTALNQGSHCFLGVAPLPGRVVQQNTSLFGMLIPQFCEGIEGLGFQLSAARSKQLGLAIKA
jgi:hypothetical protein